MWYVDVYSSKSHWGVLIDELCESFCTREGARIYASVIRKDRPEYRIEIYKA